MQMKLVILNAMALLLATTISSASAKDIASLIIEAEAQTQIADQANPLTVLSETDAALYREIFDLQEGGNWKAADNRIATISNPILMGYVEHQRYMHPTAYRSSFNELKKWMAYYADHPQAKEIYSLARKRRPKGATNPQKPVGRKWRQKPDDNLHPQLIEDYQTKSKTRVRQIEGHVRYRIHRSEALKGLKYINTSRHRRDLTTHQYNRMRSWIAASLYYQGYIDRAQQIASDVADETGDTAVLAYWIDGLIAFRQGNMNRAYTRFQAMANVPYQEDKLRSGAAYWAARTGLASGNTQTVYANLDVAAQYPFTFYGQLALAQLGRAYDYNWSTPALSNEGFDALAQKIPAIKRAAALVQAGKKNAADLELRWANGRIDTHEDYDLIAVATALNLPAAQIDTALLGRNPYYEANYLQAALYPIPEYTPTRGFKTDRALLYALMRQESKFKTEATSRVGARGLMQLMPRTASFIGKDRSLQYASGRNRLYDPSFNMELGQKYVNHLLDSAAKDNILRMAVAYNGGPGNLRRWSKQMNIEDSLLFIESIPNTESRDFAENVLTNLWVYRARLGQPAPSRDRIAAGELPIFDAIDGLSEGL